MIANIIYSGFFKFGGELQLLDPQGILDHGFSTASDLNKKLGSPSFCSLSQLYQVKCLYVCPMVAIIVMF